MSAELQAAYTKVGGAAAVCDHCRPMHAISLPELGLQPKGKLQRQSSFNIKTRFDHITQNHAQCWLCCWLLLLVSNRRQKSLQKINLRDHDKVWLGFEPHAMRTFETGKTSADTYKDTRELVRMTAWMDTRQVDGDFDNFIYFQMSDPNPSTLSLLLDQTESLDWPDHTAFTTRIRPSTVDMRLLQRWKHQCLNSHIDLCKSTTVGPVQKLRLIDVENRCIVESAANVSWVALSYCWGGPQQHALLTRNCVDYHKPGTLADPILPPVILDAISVTQNMGERYLWVDSLCIIQDNEVDKVRYLSSMDSIYAHARFTIINAAGSNVNAPVGLPGVKTIPQRRPQTPFMLNGTWLSEALDPRHGYYSGYVERTTWHARGWTFQEALLSRRCLIFTEDQVYWHCQQSSWCEGSFWERDDELQIYRHFLGDNLLTSILTPPNGNWNQVYTAILTTYLTRYFTSESDRLHALVGILRVLSKAIGDDFHWGLPRVEMEHYLSFSTMRFDSLRRTQPHKTIEPVTNVLISSPFPSWSWLGWQGQVGHVGMSVTVGTLGLKFYRLECISSPQNIAVGEVASNRVLEIVPKLIVETTPMHVVENFTDMQALIRYPPDAKHDKWMDTSKQGITTAILPNKLSFPKYKNLLPSILSFYTSIAMLKISFGAYSSYHNQFRAVLGDDSGNKTSGLFGSERQIDLPDKAMFIVIGARRLRMSHGGDLTLHLLLLEPFRDEDLKEGLVDSADASDLEGVVWRRKHLVTEVREAEWEKLECRKWDIVHLA